MGLWLVLWNTPRGKTTKINIEAYTDDVMNNFMGIFFPPQLS